MSVDLGTPHLRLHLDPPVATCTVDNPTRRNALSPAMYHGIAKALEAVAADPTVHAMVLTGVDDVFIVGGDIEEHEAERAEVEHRSPTDLLFGGAVPVIAAINGHCQASGVLFGLLADVSIASDRARFRLPELHLGVAPPWSSSVLPAFVGMGRAKELALTGRVLDAEEAAAIGLVNRVVPHDELPAAAMAAAREVLHAAPGARRLWMSKVHGQLRHFSDADVHDSTETPEAREGFAAFLERRKPIWCPDDGVTAREDLTKEK